jgi:Fe-S-cluster containining protein
MGRYTSLPDPFVAELDHVPGFRDLTTGFTLCPTCERCERSVVYLTPREQAAAARLGLRLYGKGAATRMNRHGCRCPFYEGPDRGCAHYRSRPLICHLFPFDVVEHETVAGSYWWVLFGACEEVARGKLQGRIEEARRVAAEIDRRMPDPLKRSLLADAAGAVFEPVFYRHPIHYLVPVTLREPGRPAGENLRSAEVTGRGGDYSRTSSAARRPPM